MWKWWMLAVACGGSTKGTAEPSPTVETDSELVTTDSGDVVEPAPALVFDGPRPRNLLVLSIDTTRRDRIGPQPAGGVELLQHHSCSNWTSPSVVCALAGLADQYFSYLPPTALPPWAELEEPTFLADLMENQGYASHVVTANSHLCNTYPVGRSYETVECMPYEPAAGLLARGSQLIGEREAAGDPWFLHLHFMDPHGPYDPPDEYLTELEGLPPTPVDLSETASVKGLKFMIPKLSEAELDNILVQLDIRYNAQLRYWDDELAAAWAGWEASGALEDTLVVFWSDHGEQLYDHGEFDHGNDLYSEENSALALFWARGLAPAAYTQPTTHVDLLPTVLDALAFPTPAGLPGDVVGMRPGQPLLALHAQGSNALKQSVTLGRLRLHYDWSGEKSLFDLEADPLERQNIYDPDRPEVIEMWSLLEAYGYTAVDVGP